MDRRRVAVACLALAACGRLDFGPIPPDGGSGVTIGTCIAEVATGELATCAVRTDGELYCWGSNINGQIGNGERSSTPTPVVVGAAGYHLAAGTRHTCAVVNGDPGEVSCWGDNTFGQLGDGTTEPRIGPTGTVSPSGMAELSGVQLVGAGGMTSCAATADSVYCWGDGEQGQLGNGARTSSVTPVKVSNLGGVKFLSVGGAHACAIDTNDAVWCWGDNAFGQLGTGTTTSSAVPVKLAAFSAKIVRAGAASTCALDLQSDAYCWGSDEDGKLGNGPLTTADQNTPQLVASGGSKYQDIDVGSEHACASVIGSGHAECWGRNNQRLGTGDADSSSIPVDVVDASSALLANTTQVAVGSDSTCATLAAGGMACWGQNDAGELGTGSYDGTFTAVTGGPTGDWTEIVAGGYQMCALNAAHEIQCWGSNSSGEVGAPSVPTAPFTPVHVASGIGHVAIGTYHACAVGTDGLARCWGRNHSTLGTSGPTEELSPTVVPGLSNLANVAAGEALSCVLSANGTVSCWGGSVYVGTNEAQDQPTPQLLNIDSIVELEATSQHACARSATQTWCWGQNIDGRTGDGTTNAYLLLPVALAIPPTTSVGPGGLQTCATTTAGEVYCWGNNSYGQIVGDAATNELAPVITTEHADEIVSGELHACSRTGDLVRCWGANQVGQAGTAAAPEVPPTNVAGVAARQLTSRSDHTCAVTTDNQVSCWGSNFAGQLGDGTTRDRATPQVVNVPCD